MATYQLELELRPLRLWDKQIPAGLLEEAWPLVHGGRRIPPRLMVFVNETEGFEIAANGESPFIMATFDGHYGVIGSCMAAATITRHLRSLIRNRRPHHFQTANIQSRPDPIWK